MSTFLAILTGLLLMVAGALRKRKPRPVPKSALAVRYFHPGHTWMRPTEDGYAVVGIDEFAQSVIGSIDEIELPRLLRRVEQGGVACFVWHGDRLVPMVSPVTGRVVEKNEMVTNNPNLVNISPYNDGWLFKVRPAKMKSQLQNLFTGKAAHQWQDAAKARLSQLFSGIPALMYQDGGVFIDNLADRCSDLEWKEVAKQMFLVDEDDVENFAGVRKRRREKS